MPSRVLKNNSTVLISSYNWGDESSEKLINFPKVTQLVSYRADENLSCLTGESTFLTTVQFIYYIVNDSFVSCK